MTLTAPMITRTTEAKVIQPVQAGLLRAVAVAMSEPPNGFVVPVARHGAARRPRGASPGPDECGTPCAPHRAGDRGRPGSDWDPWRWSRSQGMKLTSGNRADGPS